MTEAIGLRARKKQNTRQAIIDVAMRLFTKRGYDNVSIARICDEVGVSSRSFFRYFASKEDIVFYDVHAYRDAFTHVLNDPKPGETTFDILKRAALAVTAEVEARIDSLRPRMLLVRSRPGLLSKWAELDTSWREGNAALLKKEKLPDADIVAGALVGGVNAAFWNYVASAKPHDLRRRIERVFKIVSFK